MWWTLVFKNHEDEHHETWEDNWKILSYFIMSELTMPWSYDGIDLLIGRAHRARSRSWSLMLRNKPKPVVTNRATYDTFSSLKVKFFHHFYIPFFFLFLRPEKVPLVALFIITIIFHIPFLKLFLVKKHTIRNTYLGPLILVHFFKSQGKIFLSFPYTLFFLFLRPEKVS